MLTPNLIESSSIYAKLNLIRLRFLKSEAELDRIARKLLIPTPATVHVAWCCHSSSWLLLKILAPSIRRMMVMNQKSEPSSVIAKPPRRTTVAQINPRVPIPVAVFSRIASCRAKSVSFFSGAGTVDFLRNANADETEAASAVSPLSTFSMLLRRSKTVSFEPLFSSNFSSSDTYTNMKRTLFFTINNVE